MHQHQSLHSIASQTHFVRYLIPLNCFSTETKASAPLTAFDRFANSFRSTHYISLLRIIRYTHIFATLIYSLRSLTHSIHKSHSVRFVHSVRNLIPFVSLTSLRVVRSAHSTRTRNRMKMMIGPSDSEGPTTRKSEITQ